MMAKSNDEMRSEAERLLNSADVPQDNSIADGFVAMNEMFVAIQKGGFTLGQALWIIGFIINSGAEKYPGMNHDNDK